MTVAQPLSPRASPDGIDQLARSPLPPRLGRALGFAGALLLGELALLAVCHRLQLPFILGFIGHVSLLAVAVVSMTRVAGRDGAYAAYYLTLLATLSTGAAGAALSVVALVLLWRQRPNTAMLDEWYDRISQAGDVAPMTALTTKIAMGRSVDTDGALPHSFEQVINRGSLHDQQAALGLIARRFSPEYAPALRAALVSSEPVIRVQAAAVAVKVRGEAASALSLAIRQAQVATLSMPIARDLAVRIDALIRSQLLEEFDRSRGEDVLAQLLDGLVDADPFQGLDNALPTDVAARNVIETHLLRHGRYGEVRAAREAIERSRTQANRHELSS